MKTFFRSLLMLICILIASCYRLPEGVVKCIECKGKGKVIICKNTVRKAITIAVDAAEDGLFANIVRTDTKSV